MTKEKVEKHVVENLNEGDSLVGFFQATSSINILLFLLIGPLAMLSMKMYFVAVSSSGIYFNKLSLFGGKIDSCDFFRFDEIEHVKIGKGWLQRPIKFQFKNGKKLKIKAQLKGVEKVAKLTPDVQQQIEDNVETLS